MFGNYFYNQSLKRNLELFEFIFKDIQIQRQSANGSITQSQTVPIAWVAGEKYMQQRESDPDLTKSVSMQSPRLAYDMIALQRDPERQMQPTNKLYNVLGPGNEDVRFMPSPYNLIFELYLYARNTEDAFKVVEQIIPYFTPFFSVSAALVDGQPSFPININLDNSAKSDRFEGIISDKRDYQWVLSFTMNTWLFGPDISARGSVIKWVTTTETTDDVNISANVPYYSMSTNTYVYEAGTPIANIQPTDNYTIIVENTET